jgi:uncharacterized protein
MSQEAQNVAVLEKAYADWASSKGTSGDLWKMIFADNVKFGSIAQGGHGAAYLTAYQSRDDLTAYFDGITRDWDMVEFVTDQFIAQDDHVVMRGHCSWRFKRTGKVVSTPKADFWRFADGKAVEFFEFYDTAKLGAATS